MITRRAFTQVAGIAAAQRPNARSGPLHTGARRELFVDREMIAETRGVELRLATPIDRGTALELDRPWEQMFSGYSTLIQDGTRFLLYYRGMPVSNDGSTDEVTCYAESTDGIRWTRPDLGLYTIHGTRNNNVILANSPPFSHNFTPFLDTRPGVDRGQRFKAVAGLGKTGLVGFTSADGIQWTKLGGEPVLASNGRWAFDSQNLAFWSEAEQQYVLYHRSWKKIAGTDYRWISRAVSPDFREFTPAGEMDFGNAPPQQLYTNQTSPYFRAPHIYVGICARFLPGRQVISAEQAQAIRVDPKYYKDCSDAVLITSRGGNRYMRTFLEAFLRPGLGIENWVSRSNYPALNLIPSGSSAMSFLVNRNYGQPTARLTRYELRLDGFASAHAGFDGGELITRPVIAQGERLELNYSTSAAGSIRAAIEGEASSTPEITGDEIGRVCELPGLSERRGKPVQLRFHLKDADLFSYRFQ